MSIFLSQKEIENLTQNKYFITVADSVTSTNTVLKEQARNGAPHGSVLIAKGQTAGRGRLGRSFYSPENSGLYMSILIRNNIKPEFSQFITPAAAVAVTRSLKKAGVNNLGIKWVNDIYCNNKKVCGILTEVEFLKNSISPAFFIVGIGINLNTKDFPEDIKNTAGSVFRTNQFDVNVLCAEIINNLFLLCENLIPENFIGEYKSQSILNGRDVLLISGEKQTPAHILGIDDSFRLVAKLGDNSILHINTGEVSIKL